MPHERDGASDTLVAPDAAPPRRYYEPPFFLLFREGIGLSGGTPYFL